MSKFEKEHVNNSLNIRFGPINFRVLNPYMEPYVHPYESPELWVIFLNISDMLENPKQWHSHLIWTNFLPPKLLTTKNLNRVLTPESQRANSKENTTNNYLNFRLMKPQTIEYFIHRCKLFVGWMIFVNLIGFLGTLSIWHGHHFGPISTTYF